MGILTTVIPSKNKDEGIYYDDMTYIREVVDPETRRLKRMIKTMKVKPKSDQWNRNFNLSRETEERRQRAFFAAREQWWEANGIPVDTHKVYVLEG